MRVRSSAFRSVVRRGSRERQQSVRSRGYPFVPMDGVEVTSDVELEGEPTGDASPVRTALLRDELVVKDGAAVEVEVAQWCGRAGPVGVAGGGGGDHGVALGADLGGR